MAAFLRTRRKILVASIFLSGIVLFYFGKTDASIAVLISSLILHTASTVEKRRKVGNPELISFLRSFTADYKKAKSVQLALEKSLKHGFSFTARLRKALSVYGLGGIPEPSHHDNLDKLVGVLYNGYRTGADISKALELFAERIEVEEERKNSETRLSSSMNMIMQAGMAFFFPMFGGISAGILDFISRVPMAAFQEKFSMIIFGYIIIIAIIYSSFYKSARNAADMLYSSIPYISAGIIVFSLSTVLIHEVI